MCNGSIFIQSAVVWRASWSISVLSTALPCFVRGSCLSCFWPFFFPPPFGYLCDANNAISALCLMLQGFLYVVTFICWAVSTSLKISIGACVWWYLVIKRKCISWFVRLLLLLVSISLIYVRPLFPYTQKLLLHGHQPGILILLSAPFSDLVALQLVPKCCCLDLLESLLSWCPLIFRSNPSPHYFHSSWSIPQ